jgi:hypothetical protein
MKIRIFCSLVCLSVFAVSSIESDYAYAQPQEQQDREEIDDIKDPIKAVATHPLVDKNIEIAAGETHTFAVPGESNEEPDSGRWFLTMLFQVTTIETAVAFDDPALEVTVDDALVYRLAAKDVECENDDMNKCQSGWLKRTFVLMNNEKPAHISVWSGNSGDNEQPTTVLVKELNVFKGEVDSGGVAVGELRDHHSYKDNAENLSVEWLAPQVFTNHLDRALRYEFKLSENKPSTTMSDEVWEALPPSQIILPFEAPYLARIPGEYEQKLFHIPSAMPRGYLLMRAVDWQGKRGPITHLEF